MQPPDIETRRAILRKKAEAFHIELAEDVLAFLAQRVRTNVRRLEGALMRVASYQSLSGREFSRETVEQLLRDILREEVKKTVITNKPSCHDSVSEAAWHSHNIRHSDSPVAAGHLIERGSIAIAILRNTAKEIFSQIDRRALSTADRELIRLQIDPQK